MVAYLRKWMSSESSRLALMTVYFLVVNSKRCNIIMLRRHMSFFRDLLTYPSNLSHWSFGKRLRPCYQTLNVELCNNLWASNMIQICRLNCRPLATVLTSILTTSLFTTVIKMANCWLPSWINLWNTRFAVHYQKIYYHYRRPQTH